MLKVAMIAGEPSGDMLASDLIVAIKAQDPTAEFVGIGGTKMQEQGFKSWYDMEQLSVLGFIEVVKHLPRLLWLRYQIIKDIIAYQPDVFIGVDAPDFNFYIEKRLKKHGIKTIHYVSPSLWAWRYNRIFKIKNSTDLMLCLFPFEPEIYQKQGIAADFMGHPLAAQIEFSPDSAQYKQELLPEVSPNTLVITILCGSRRQEINMMAPEAIQAATIIQKKLASNGLHNNSKIIFLFPVPNKVYSIMEQQLQDLNPNFSYQIIVDNTLSAIKACDIALVKSGTVSLEVALCKKPMIIFYKVNPLSAYFIKRMIKIKFVGLANIIAMNMGLEPLVPELLQKEANPVTMAETIVSLYQNLHLQQEMIAQFQKIHRALQKPADYKAIVAKILS